MTEFGAEYIQDYRNLLGQDTPIRFTLTGNTVPESRNDYIRPVIGGLKIESEDSPTSEDDYSTSGFKAIKNGEGVLIIAAHAIDSTDDRVWQPHHASSPTYVGTMGMEPYNDAYVTADAATVIPEDTQLSPKVYGTAAGAPENYVVKGWHNPVDG